MRSINARHRFWTVDGQTRSNASGLADCSQTPIASVLDFLRDADFAGLIPLGKPDKPCSCLHSLARSGAQIPYADDFVIPSVCPYVRCVG